MCMGSVQTIIPCFRKGKKNTQEEEVVNRGAGHEGTQQGCDVSRGSSFAQSMERGSNRLGGLGSR